MLNFEHDTDKDSGANIEPKWDGEHNASKERTDHFTSSMTIFMTF